MKQDCYRGKSSIRAGIRQRFPFGFSEFLVDTQAASRSGIRFDPWANRGPSANFAERADSNFGSARRDRARFREGSACANIRA